MDLDEQTHGQRQAKGYTEPCEASWGFGLLLWFYLKVWTECQEEQKTEKEEKERKGDAAFSLSTIIIKQDDRYFGLNVIIVNL